MGVLRTSYPVCFILTGTMVMSHPVLTDGEYWKGLEVFLFKMAERGLTGV